MTADPELVPVAQGDDLRARLLARADDRFGTTMTTVYVYDQEMRLLLREAAATIADHARIVAVAEMRVAEQCRNTIEQTARAVRAESELAALRARVGAAPVGTLYCSYVLGSDDFALSDDAGYPIDLRAFKGQRVRLLAAPAGGEG